MEHEQLFASDLDQCFRLPARSCHGSACVRVVMGREGVVDTREIEIPRASLEGTKHSAR